MAENPEAAAEKQPATVFRGGVLQSEPRPEWYGDVLSSFADGKRHDNRPDKVIHLGDRDEFGPALCVYDLAEAAKRPGVFLVGLFDGSDDDWFDVLCWTQADMLAFLTGPGAVWLQSAAAGWKIESDREVVESVGRIADALGALSSHLGAS